MHRLHHTIRALVGRLAAMREPGGWGYLALSVTAVRMAMSVVYQPHWFLTASYDDGNYIARAEMLAGGSWATVFDRQTFLRGPLYAIYLAVVDRSGLPLAVVDMVLTLAVSWWLAHELTRFVGVGRAGRSLVYLGLVVVPSAETLTGSHVIRDDLAQLVLLAVFACTFRALRGGLGSWPYAVGAVLGAGLTTIIREDALWMLPSLVVLVIVVLRRAAAARAWAVAASLTVLCVAAFAGPRVAVTQLNARSGLPAPTLFDDDHFAAAHASIARYVNDGTQNTRTLDPVMFDRLVEGSPAFATIAPGFLEWRREQGIVYLDAVRFAMAGGLDAAGVLADRSLRDSVLGGVAGEVAELCRLDGRPACDGWVPAPPPLGVVRANDLAAAARRPLTEWRPLLTVERGPLATAGDDGPLGVLRQWERVTNTSPTAGSYTVDGDTVRFGPRLHNWRNTVQDAYRALGALLTPVVRVAGLASLGLLVWRRQFGILGVAVAVLMAVYLRSAQVALATRFGVGDYDFHYLQPAATSLTVVALMSLAAAAQAVRPTTR